jgi:hypothetical protein
MAVAAKQSAESHHRWNVTLGRSTAPPAAPRPGAPSETVIGKRNRVLGIALGFDATGGRPQKAPMVNESPLLPLIPFRLDWAPNESGNN